MNTKPTALDAYLARTAAIHAKLERLQQLADDHFGHGRDQFTLCQQGIHPASEPMLADGMEGVGQFVAALVKTVAAFSLQIRLYCSQSFSSGIIESQEHAVVPYGKSTNNISITPSGISFITSRQSPR